jgi:indolepyruvate ferredoxin oxidoreductase alpha subunit
MNNKADEKTTLALLGDEAVGLGAIHAGLSAAYGYPGTPSTEIMEYLQGKAGNGGGFVAKWCSNEKTATEAAIGTSFAGRRALVTMKHVGLNVASDPFMNSALLGIHGGLVIAVADDPGMHSSQCEQDSRFYANFGMVPCLEPRNQQEAYNMCLEAFEISEKFSVPVMLRLVTRLSHARAAVNTGLALEPKPISKIKDKTQWILIPAYARRNYINLVEKQKDLDAWSAGHQVNKLELEGCDLSFAVISSGLGGNYYDENLEDLISARGGKNPAHLHIGAYPIPTGSIRKLCEKAEKVLVIEEGQPLIEKRLRGILPQNIAINGKLDATLSRTGELDPDTVRKSLGLPPRASVLDKGLKIPALPERPPQLCQGCPHGDSYSAINKAVAELDPDPSHPNTTVTSDIGCYSLGAAPPYSTIESVVCMGASISMARGAADAGIKYALAVIGDSTFLHSGITCLVDAVQSDVPMTVIILDNSIVAMTGCQETIVPSAKLRDLILGLGLKPEHLLELEAKGQFLEENAGKLKKEMEYRGLSVVIFRRECLEAFRKRRKSGN